MQNQGPIISDKRRKNRLERKCNRHPPSPTCMYLGGVYRGDYELNDLKIDIA